MFDRRATDGSTARTGADQAGTIPDHGTRGRDQERTLVEYLLIAQDRCVVEHYVRQPDGSWLFSEASSLQDVIDLPSVGCKLALADVYEDVLVLVE